MNKRQGCDAYDKVNDIFLLNQISALHKNTLYTEMKKICSKYSVINIKHCYLICERCRRWRTLLPSDGIKKHLVHTSQQK